MKSQIKSFEDACKFLAITAALPLVAGLPQKYQKGVITDHQRVVVTEALNKEANAGKEWLPIYDGSEWHYFPYFDMQDEEGKERGSGFSFYYCGFEYRYSTVGSRLEFISREVCLYAVETFPDLFRDAFLMLPQPAEQPAEATETAQEG